MTGITLHKQMNIEDLTSFIFYKGLCIYVDLAHFSYCLFLRILWEFLSLEIKSFVFITLSRYVLLFVSH